MLNTTDNGVLYIHGSGPKRQQQRRHQPVIDNFADNSKRSVRDESNIQQVLAHICRYADMYVCSGM